MAQYRAVRLAMAKKYEHDISLFGPVSITPPARQMQELKQQEKAVYDVQSKQENNLISRGHNRILEKVKSLRQGFFKAVLAGRRSGCGKLVYDHYDSLKGIWGGSPNTEPLPSGVDTDEVNQVHHLEDETDESHAT